MTSEQRWYALELLQDSYPEFEDFLYDGMTDLMGFCCTDLQRSIAREMQYGSLRLMLQAQRSQAKTTIAAFFVVWCLIHYPGLRGLIVSAGGSLASQIAKWVQDIILDWNILECLRPDKKLRDRTSIAEFDVHRHLKGADKSPSVACLGITANMQGYRSDLTIADDVESSKNGLTEVQRSAIIHKTRDFSSICKGGRIIYLGTPQSCQSIYNTLPGRGFDIKIWPGRYPTEAEQEHYGEFLASFITDKLKDNPDLRTGGGVLGDRGKPTDPELHLVNEEELTKTEVDQGPAYFQLQCMLDTALTDMQRYPLKTKNLVVLSLNKEEAPESIKWLPSTNNKLLLRNSKLELYYAFSISSELRKYMGTVMYVDPAGGGRNGDETAYAICSALNGNIFVHACSGIPGGFEVDKLVTLSEIAQYWNVQHVQVEKNFGNGAFGIAWAPILRQYINVGIEDVWETGQKELRIIDTLEPVLGRHSLILNEDILENDVISTQMYPLEQRSSYELMFQLSMITRDKGCLLHDD